MKDIFCKDWDGLASALEHLQIKYSQPIIQAGLQGRYKALLVSIQEARGGNNPHVSELSKYSYGELCSIKNALNFEINEYMVLENESFVAEMASQNEIITLTELQKKIQDIINEHFETLIKTGEHQRTFKPANNINTVREVVSVFDTPQNLQAALDDLMAHGFMQHELSILADDTQIEKKLGHLYNRVEEAEDDPEAPRTTFVPNEVIGEAIGALITVPMYITAVTAAAIITAAGATDSAIIETTTLATLAGVSLGLLLAGLAYSHRMKYICSQMEHGGFLLWALLRSPGQEKQAQEVLKYHKGHDIHIHQIPVSSI